jgi:hypothetical protein
MSGLFLRTHFSNFQLPALLPAIITVLVSGVYGVANADEFTSLSAHQHGHGLLSIALDKDQLFVELTAPAINLLGAEHRPTDPAASKQFQQKADYLKSLVWVKLPSEANCQVDSVDLMSPLLGTADADQISRDAKEITAALWQTNEKSSTEPESAKAHNHDHPEDEHKHAASHSDVVVSASFRCAEPSKLSTVTIHLWESSVELNELSAQWILPSGQGAAVLTQSSPTIKL